MFKKRKIRLAQMEEIEKIASQIDKFGREPERRFRYFDHDSFTIAHNLKAKLESELLKAKDIKSKSIDSSVNLEELISQLKEILKSVRELHLEISYQANKSSHLASSNVSHEVRHTEKLVSGWPQEVDAKFYYTCKEKVQRNKHLEVKYYPLVKSDGSASYNESFESLRKLTFQLNALLTAFENSDGFKRMKVNQISENFTNRINSHNKHEAKFDERIAKSAKEIFYKYELLVQCFTPDPFKLDLFKVKGAKDLFQIPLAYFIKLTEANLKITFTDILDVSDLEENVINTIKTLYRDGSGMSLEEMKESALALN